jgi:electron transport complex protein RnfE
MAKKQKSLKEIFFAGWIKENPTLRLVLGTCPTLAVTTQAVNGLGMGAAATLVLLGSNIVISLLRNIIPDKVRIPAFITIIAGFVTMIQMLVKAFVPALDQSLGIFLPLIVVNCIILGRAESFASKNKVFLPLWTHLEWVLVSQSACS